MSKEVESHSEKGDIRPVPSGQTSLEDSSKGQVTQDILIVKSAQDYVTDIKHMLEHCRDQGIPISMPLENDIGELYSAPTEGKLTKVQLVKLLRVHGQLSRIVAPATPLSLASTQFSLREKQSLLTCLLVTFLILAAIVGLVGYVVTLPPLDSGSVESASSDDMLTAPDSTKASFDSKPLATLVETSSVQQCVSATTKGQFCVLWNYVFAAIIGAAFNGLLTAYRYLRNRTFDPHYVGIYIIRFVIGVLAGVILANVGSKLFQENPTITHLGPGIIALLGGYSAEAVRQILDRLVEVLVSVVQGRETFDQQRLVVAKEVLSIAQAAAADANTPTDVKEKLDGLLKKLQQ